MNYPYTSHSVYLNQADLNSPKPTWNLLNI